MRRFIIGTLALIGTLLLAFILEGGNPLDFFLPSPLLIVVGVPCFAVLAVWSLKDWGRAWKDAFAAGSARGAAPSGSASTSARLWDFYEKACYIAGVVGFILGLNIIFQHGGKIDPQDILTPLSVVCITPILAILLAMVARILRARVEKSGA
jgi:hypothetical protein